eukprot:3188342-Rhodomonas_salina.2
MIDECIGHQKRIRAVGGVELDTERKSERERARDLDHMSLHLAQHTSASGCCSQGGGLWGARLVNPQQRYAELITATSQKYYELQHQYQPSDTMCSTAPVYGSTSLAMQYVVLRWSVLVPAEDRCATSPRVLAYHGWYASIRRGCEDSTETGHVWVVGLRRCYEGSTDITQALVPTWRMLQC